MGDGKDILCVRFSISFTIWSARSFENIRHARPRPGQPGWGVHQGRGFGLRRYKGGAGRADWKWPSYPMARNRRKPSRSAKLFSDSTRNPLKTLGKKFTKK